MTKSKENKRKTTQYRKSFQYCNLENWKNVLQYK